MENYLSKVIFKNISLGDSKKLKEKLICEQKIDIKKNENFIKTILSSNCQEKNEKWINCTRKCYKFSSEEINREIKSTAFILKCLANSVLPKKGLSFNFDINNFEKITGIWENDKHFFEIISENKKSKLIFGYGPSASGKTQWSKNLIKLFSQIKNFPNFFLSIDGGIYRESSVVYQTLKNTANQLCYLGLNNLAGFSFFSKKIFDSDIVKNIIIEYLGFQEKKISLYIPETLSNCGLLFNSCRQISKKFVELTNDTKYISLLIFQHKTARECNYKENFRCFGCEESGRLRQVKDGKKYNSSAYFLSMLNSEKELKYGYYRYIIHNSGRNNGKTVIWDDNLRKNNLTKILEKNQKQYNFLLKNCKTSNLSK